jgi:hypothetical protein
VKETHDFFMGIHQVLETRVTQSLLHLPTILIR